MPELPIDGAFGPLDLVRHVNDKAVEYDRRLLVESLGEVELTEVRDSIKGLAGITPLMGRLVVARGAVLSPILDDDGEKIGYTPVNSTMEVRGLYRGFEMAKCAVSVGEVGYFDQPRAVHVIITSSLSYRDENYNFITVNPSERVLVAGCDIEPVEPIDSHSFQDLRNDAIVEKIDQIVYKGEDLHKTMMKLRRLLVPKQRINAAETAKLRQRLSYLNSLGLLDGTTAIAPIAACDIEEYPNIFSVLKSPDGCIPFSGIYAFDIQLDFRSLKGEYVLTDKYNLFLRAKTDDLGELLVPYRADLQVDYVNKK